ncbi:MAG: accessory factor UbiK family protein [Proteobacteria bacterium]|nr:accessory factor UbiK family protein [Pseudomonadota bacterium]MCH9758578.1 accessory factor UbiK family protein [Pseudomonadota bacterium]
MNDTPNNGNEKLVNDFCNRLQHLLEQSPLAGLRQTAEDSKENIRAIVEALLGQMNVVSRSEFEAQNALLAETAAKLARIEEKLTAIEKQQL